MVSCMEEKRLDTRQKKSYFVWARCLRVTIDEGAQNIGGARIDAASS